MNSIEEAIEAIRNGEILIVSDDEHRENEADLVMAGECVSPEAINFMSKYGRGLVCAPVTEAIANQIGLKEMQSSKDRFGTAFTNSIDLKVGNSTGISAADRAATIKSLCNPQNTTDDYYSPGHTFPLIARHGGVRVRNGHTEATIDLCLLAGLKGVGVICEILNDDGSMARVSDLKEYQKEHKLKWINIAQLQDYLKDHIDIYEDEQLLSPVMHQDHVNLPSAFAEKDFELYCFTAREDGKEHAALVYGEIENADSLLVRVHSECLTGDVFHSSRCDCGEQLHSAINSIVKEGQGIIVYLRQEGRGIGLINKIKAYNLQNKGLDTVDANVELGFPADLRDYSIAATILKNFNINSIRLLTNNPDKVSSLEANGLTVSERVPIIVEPKEENEFYLKTKKSRLGHLL